MAVHDLLTFAYFLTGAPPVTTSKISDSVGLESPARTADILLFPTPAKAEALSPDQRLAQALVSLNEALAQQRVAVVAWREVLSELRTASTSLHDSVQRYRANLRTLGNSVSSLQAKARSLEAWADHVSSSSE
jgi:ABC-type transporter Mla subunit MlaD